MKMNSTWYVLIGGESMEDQGSNISTRSYLHTSLTHIGYAYETLRSYGISRDHIIVIVQLNDYMNSLHVQNNKILRELIQKECNRLISEGGADYDFEMVNPGTIWCVMLGIKSKLHQKVVPTDAGAIFLAIYSHGDCHSCTPSHVPSDTTSRNHIDPLKYEWFAHMPYTIYPPFLKHEMLEFVSVDGATGTFYHTPERYIYATTLRCIFTRLFHMNSTRPVVSLLNFCFSGGMLEFMNRPVSVAHTGSDQWPLFLMSSSQSTQDALIGGLWTSFFDHLHNYFNSKSASSPATLVHFFSSVRALYFKSNSYELHGCVVDTAYAAMSSGRQIYTQFSRDITPFLCGDDGEPMYDELRRLQMEYKSRRSPRGRKIIIWLTERWGEEEADLVKVVREARSRVAQPCAVFGQQSGVADILIDDLMR